MRQISRNAACWCGSGKKYKRCHLPIDQRQRSEDRSEPGIILKTPEQVEGIRRACRLTVEILDWIGPKIVPGVTTNQIDRWVHDYTVERGATPATLGYKKYPKSTCTSINHVVCHGIPNDKPLVEGDIMNVDVTSVLGGYFGDASRMYVVGEASEEALRLVRVARECTELGVAEVRPGGKLGDLGFVIEEHAHKHGYSVVQNIGGHGVGLKFHEEPYVPHFGRRGEGIPLYPGMVFTVEPMINAGTEETRTLRDGWTVITADGKLSAQWEHTVAVGEAGVDVLTG